MFSRLYHFLYDVGLLKSRAYNFPVICVGNLSVGGTGKTPMIEYLIQIFKDDYLLATLSRGYKRKTKGFVLANENITVEAIGDEPFQFYNKFNNIIVSVAEDRQKGIAALRKLQPKPDIILLDDAFQHRKVKAGINILLTSYHNLYVDDIVLPTGNLREPRSGAKRATVIIVTKSPKQLDENEKLQIKRKLKLKPSQSLFFSSILYSDYIFSKHNKRLLSEIKTKNITLVTGIANEKPLIRYLKSIDLKFEHLSFKDHHYFSKKEIEILNTKAFILTTEKDFMRLSHKIKSKNLYYLPISISLDQAEDFKLQLGRY